MYRAHERYRQTTDGRAIAYSEREREFTFAKNDDDDDDIDVYKVRWVIRMTELTLTRCRLQ